MIIAKLYVTERTKTLWLRKLEDILLSSNFCSCSARIFSLCFAWIWKGSCPPQTPDTKMIWNVENDFFGFPEVKWLQHTGELGKCKAVGVIFYQDLTHQKSLKSFNFWQSYLKNKKGGRFGTQCTLSNSSDKLTAVQCFITTLGHWIG